MDAGRMIMHHDGATSGESAHYLEGHGGTNKG